MNNISPEVEIAKLEEHNSKLKTNLDDLTNNRESINRRVAYYEHLHNQKTRMEKEIARMEGRDYCDPENPDGEWPDPTDQPPEL